VRALGFHVGGDGGSNCVKGTVDNLETFNFALTPLEVSRYWASHHEPKGSNACFLAPIALHVGFQTTLTNGQIASTTNGIISGNFGWLNWSGENGFSRTDLGTALTNHYLSTNFINVEDPTDHTLSVGDWISGDSGVEASVGSSLHILTNEGRIFGVVLWNTALKPGNNSKYQAAAYANIKLLDYNLSQKWLTFQYLGPMSCDSISNATPRVWLAAPATNQLFNSVATVPLSAWVFDPEDMVAHVEFYSGTNLLATVVYDSGLTNTSTNVFSFTWIGVTNGNYTLTAVATDELGVRGTSGPVSIVVNGAAVVNAGADRTLIWTTNQVTLAGTVTDDGRQGSGLTTTWKKIGGPGTVTFSNPSQTNAIATFATNGVYTLQLNASSAT